MAVWRPHRDEMEVKLEQGTETIARALVDADVTEVVEPDRPAS